ncbi:universal stress protein [Kitasatospora sp. NPDC052896]|uniref:universal stress protein n=1 Tax=Kitasatospora sp. NPDC052896 TaxID=3364061 RepID=UPI0037CC5814
MTPEGLPPVVVGVDPDNPSRMVLAWAADEADRRDLPLRLVLASRLMTRDVAWPLAAADMIEQDRLDHLAGEQVLAEAAQFVAGRCPRVPVEVRQLDGDPIEVLRDQAEDAAQVVLGSRRLTPVRELFSAGSAAVALIAHARCPVVVVRDPEHATQNPPYLVVGVDGSPGAQFAVDHAFDVAARRGAGLRAVLAWQPERRATAERRHAAEQEYRRVLAEATAGRLEAYPEVELTHEVVLGHPVAVLSEASAHALALVVGTRGRGGFAGMLLGSVSQGVLHHAHCPVMVVPAPSLRT